MSKECLLCDETKNVKKCECGNQYCQYHLSWHKNNWCSLYKKKRGRRSDDEIFNGEEI